MGNTSKHNGKHSWLRKTMRRLLSSLEDTSFIPSPDTSNYETKIMLIRELNRVVRSKYE